MLGTSGDGAGKAKRSSPALRVSRLRRLIGRILERAEAHEDDERALKLAAAAVKLELELRLLSPSKQRRTASLGSGKQRQADDEALRQKIAERLAAFAPAREARIIGEPDERGAGRAS